MTDDELLEAVARHLRAQGADPLADRRWLALADGSIRAEDKAALDALVTSGAVPPESMTAFAPIDEPTRQRYADAALDALGRPDAAAPVVDFAAHRRRRFLIAGGVLAAAAAAVFVLRPGVKPIPSPSPEGLPEYELGFRGGDRLYRGDDDAVLRAGAPYELTLRPSTAVTGEVTVETRLTMGGQPRTWEPSVEISGSGAVRITGRIGQDVPATPTPVTLEVTLRAGDGPPRVLRQVLRVESP